MAIIIYGLMIMYIAMSVRANDDINEKTQNNQQKNKVIATLADKLVEKLQRKRNGSFQDNSFFAPTPVPTLVGMETAKQQSEQVTEESIINVSVLQDHTASLYDYPPYAPGNEEQLQENNNNNNNINPLLTNAVAEQLLASILNSPAVPVHQKVEIIKHVPYPVIQPVPVEIPQPYAVQIAVPQPYPMDVEMQKELPYLELQFQKMLVEHHIPYPVQNLLPHPIKKLHPPLIKKRIWPAFTVIRTSKELYDDD